MLPNSISVMAALTEKNTFTLGNRLSLSTRKLIFTVSDARLTLATCCCCQQSYHTYNDVA